MAYLGDDLELVAWALVSGMEESPEDTCLVARPEDSLAAETSEDDSPRGFIIRNWFGPFLLGPASRYLRGRC